MFPRVLLRDRRGSVAVMTAMLLTPIMGALALVTDASVWMVEHHRLQIAADAAAHAAAMQLTNTSFQTGSSAAFATLVANEARVATGGNWLVGTMGTPTISVAANYTSVTVTLTSTANMFFSGVVSPTAATLHATATAGLSNVATSCVMTLSTSAAQALTVDGSGKIVANNCPVFSNSSSTSAIYANGSGSITAKSVGTHGGTLISNGGSISPTATTGATAQSDPVANGSQKYTLPSASTCTYTNYTATAYKSTAYALQPGTYCGTTTIGGNGSSDTFAPGTYVFTGNVTINNANITQAAGVTFVMEGATASANAGTFNWTNNSAATLTAPTSGAYSGLLFWQACASGATSGSTVNGAVQFNGGSAITASGAFYAPCGAVQLSNNAQLNAASNSGFSVISATLSVIGSAGIQAASSTSGTGTSQVALTQ